MCNVYVEIQNDPLVALPSIGPSARKNLHACGFETVEDVREASVDELQEVPYIGKGKAEFLTEYLE